MRVRVLRSDGDLLEQQFDVNTIRYDEVEALAEEAADYAVEAHRLGFTTKIQSLVVDRWVEL